MFKWSRGKKLLSAVLAPWRSENLRDYLSHKRPQERNDPWPMTVDRPLETVRGRYSVSIIGQYTAPPRIQYTCREHHVSLKTKQYPYLNQQYCTLL
jgi:hypothetical protein